MLGTLRDSLGLPAVVLEQQTKLQTSTNHDRYRCYSDVVFGVFHLLGYHFCSRLADVGGPHF